MKKLFGLLVAAMLVMGSVSVYAGCGKCGPAGEAHAKGDCGDCFAKLKLTDDQKAKLADLKADCGKGGCPTAAKAKLDEGVKKILTASQYKQWKSECAKAGKDGGCPLAKAKS